MAYTSEFTGAEIDALLSQINNGQIAFPATQAPSTNPNTLDDYEEGTWTFDLQFSDAKVGITYAAANTTGYYTKIGRVVHCTGFMILTSKGSSVGSAQIFGLPFTSANANGAYAAVSLYLSGVTFANTFHGYIAKNAVAVDLQEITEGGVPTPLTNANFTDTSQVVFSLTYMV